MNPLFESIIKALFTDEGYVIDSECQTRWTFKHSNHHYKDYWVITDNFDRENPKEIFDYCINQFGTQSSKNISVLILNDVTQSKLNDKDKIEIENDPFYFKKYVLDYSNEELDSLLGKLRDYDTNNMTSRLLTLLMDPLSFDQLKTSAQPGSYRLAYSIAHKLPFLMLNVEHKSEIDGESVLDCVQNIHKDILDWVNGIDSIEDLKNSITNIQD